MSKEEILRTFETALTDPGSLKSGEYLEEHILVSAKKLILTDRANLVNVLREWLSMKDEPRTMLAVKVAKELDLKELVSDLKALRQDIETGKVFLPFYVRRIDEALDVLQ